MPLLRQGRRAAAPASARRAESCQGREPLPRPLWQGEAFAEPGRYQNEILIAGSKPSSFIVPGSAISAYQFIKKSLVSRWPRALNGGRQSRLWKLETKLYGRF
jgi:hypothetical protein